jgi:hypothetical protein
VRVQLNAPAFVAPEAQGVGKSSLSHVVDDDEWHLLLVPVSWLAVDW